MPEPARFVLHDHRRPSPHFDLRFEEDGVLRSWAVPKGLPDDPAHDRLAIAVDDHELDHIAFEDEHDRDQSRFVISLHGRDAVRRFALCPAVPGCPPKPPITDIMSDCVPEGPPRTQAVHSSWRRGRPSGERGPRRPERWTTRWIARSR